MTKCATLVAAGKEAFASLNVCAVLPVLSARGAATAGRKTVEPSVVPASTKKDSASPMCATTALETVGSAITA